MSLVDPGLDHLPVLWDRAELPVALPTLSFARVIVLHCVLAMFDDLCHSWCRCHGNRRQCSVARDRESPLLRRCLSKEDNAIRMEKRFFAVTKKCFAGQRTEWPANWTSRASEGRSFEYTREVAMDDDEDEDDFFAYQTARSLKNKRTQLKEFFQRYRSLRSSIHLSLSCLV